VLVGLSFSFGSGLCEGIAFLIDLVAKQEDDMIVGICE
jgi:hypothetical protein